MPELEIGLVDGGELYLDQFYLQFNVKRKIYAKSVHTKTINDLERAGTTWNKLELPETS